jgi:hypothetical protein
VLISGWVCAVATTGRSCLIRHDAARVWVEWEDLQLPAGVHYGAHVAVIGNLKTFNIGGGFHVVKACLLDVSPQAMIRAALEKYPDAVIPPRGKSEEKGFIMRRLVQVAGRHQKHRDQNNGLGIGR